MHLEYMMGLFLTLKSDSVIKNKERTYPQSSIMMVGSGGVNNGQMPLGIRKFFQAKNHHFCNK